MLTRRNFFKFPAQVAALVAAATILPPVASVPVRNISLRDLAAIHDAQLRRMVEIISETNEILADLPWSKV